MFCLNKKQHEVVKICCLALIAEFAKMCLQAPAFRSLMRNKIFDCLPHTEQPHTLHSPAQLNMVVAGEPGTGKSHCIAAIQFFAESWQNKESVCSSSYTNFAATNINSNTINKEYKLPFHASAKPAIITDQHFKERMLKRKLLIFEECGQTPAECFAGANTQTQTVCNSNENFAGLHVVWFLDWLQMSPVNSKYTLCSDLKELQNNEKKVRIFNICKFYQERNIGIKLNSSENNRITDHEMLELLKLDRVGSVARIPHRLEAWRKCVLNDENSIVVDSMKEHLFVPIVTGVNELRHSLNVSQCCSCMLKRQNRKCS
jgi:hypothetical protein